MVTVHTSLDELPRMLRNFGDQIPYAMSIALNETAYGAKVEMEKQINSQLHTRNQFTAKGTRQMPGMRYIKSNKKNLVAKVGTGIWYMRDLVGGGDHTASNVSGRVTGRSGSVGFEYEGKQYLFVPVDSRKNSRGVKLKKLSSKPFVVKSNNGVLWLVVKDGRSKRKVKALGQLVEKTNYAQETFDWEVPINRYIQAHLGRNFKKAMIRAVRTAR